MVSQFLWGLHNNNSHTPEPMYWLDCSSLRAGNDYSVHVSHLVLHFTHWQPLPCPVKAMQYLFERYAGLLCEPDLKLV